MPRNLELRERVPREQLDTLLADSFCLVNTSLFEGFPNAFLDAGRQRVPVLSLTVDPDGALETSGGGFAAGGDLAALAAEMRRLHSDPAAAREAGCRWRDHVVANHDAAAQIDLFAAELRRVFAG
jgi:glycosyltransferase involved in cell wall biosynthesis